jgi:hypothetical protein
LRRARLRPDKKFMGFQGWGSARSKRGENLLKIWGQDIGRWHRGHIKIKAVFCGKKHCKSCPHAYYAYFVDEYGKENYLGACDANGNPRQKGRPAKWK